MKKFKTIFAIMSLCLGMASYLVSCSDKENDEPVVPAAKSVEGVYKGDIMITVMGQEFTDDDVTITLTATDDATVTATISTFGASLHNTVPSITIAGIKVAADNGGYTLAPTEIKGIADDGKAYSGTIQGVSDGKNITMKFTLNYGAMPFPMVCSLNGSK